MTNNSAHTRRPLVTLTLAVFIGSAGLAAAGQAVADPAGQEQATKYSECMRANGVADFPDPNAEGQIRYGGISVSKATWQNAVDACANLQPAGWSTDAGRTPAQQDAALKFAQCVRDHGVPDFPDPASARDPLIDTSKMRGDVSASSIPELKPAVEACHSFISAALPPEGTGRPG
ncbi:hypothetical protein H5U98_01935 [Mycolicibacterium boenickei]|uniref:Secreted protein n=1 Tax=Mycolicibacterium boenickei TaxID=146017 RepID=A0AAX2ZZ32_9MYCO|nr:hypothetical protein [Mycolicibacterium boenickei]PEG61714.1 hypothetical protein CQY21_05120 [Mycolicibacterium boenickei]UNC00244.1 hypothetical protein H5U98_01935 [Mycolicibacterium boenickei]BBX89970.1 hypothetical protein MBOE_16190 [Mycolicibacterium boenickei]